MYQKRTNKKTTKEAAVSPVVGVMLMLVVTIVIAAVVTIFASGLAGTQQAAPAVSVAVDLDTNDDEITLTFLSVSEPIAMSDLQLNLKSTKIIDEDTTEGLAHTYKFYSQIETLGNVGSGAITSGTSVTKGLAPIEPDSATDTSVLVTSVSSTDDLNRYFSSYAKVNSADTNRYDVYEGGAPTAVRTGVKNTDIAISGMTEVKGHGTSGGTLAYATCNPGYTFEKKNSAYIQTVNVEELEPGDKVDVEILHIPSNSIVYAKTITVGA